ncbi:MAG: helix-turn-helix transcriptional regulator [Bacillota bacterium]|nr:helix-turn-helix transcriptional regulator [Bacillota bacterium]
MRERVWLQELRDKVGATQKEVAELLQITQQHYSYIETGVRRPSPQVAKKIAGLLGFDWTRFYEDNETSATKETA